MHGAGMGMGRNPAVACGPINLLCACRARSYPVKPDTAGQGGLCLSLFGDGNFPVQSGVSSFDPFMLSLYHYSSVVIILLFIHKDMFIKDLLLMA